MRYEFEVPNRGPFNSAAEFYDALGTAYKEHANVLHNVR